MWELDLAYFRRLKDAVTIRDGGTVIRAKTAKEEAYARSAASKVMTWSERLALEAEREGSVVA